MACHYHSAPSRPAVPLHLQYHTDSHTHTHHAPCVDSHILYSSALTHVECVLSYSQPDEWEGKTERKAKSRCGEGTQSERKLRECAFIQRPCICMVIYIYVCFLGVYAICLLWGNTRLSPTETVCGCRYLRPHNPTSFVLSAVENEENQSLPTGYSSLFEREGKHSSSL